MDSPGYTRMSETKSALQLAFRQIWNKKGRKGAAGAATGVGKTKPAIDEMMDLWDAYIFEKEPRYVETGVWISPKKIFVAVPTEEMRDINWPAEIQEWYGDNGLLMWKESVTCVCYQSMHNYKALDFDLCILDECHHLTQLSARFFNALVDTMGLSATYPDKERDPDKWFLLHQVCPLVFTYTLDQGVEDEIIAPFDIHIVRIPLDNVHKSIEAGPVKKRYMTTEAARYNVLSNTIKKMYAIHKVPAAEMLILKRRLFLCNLPSKLKIARLIVDKYCELGPTLDFATPPKRSIVFCGSIAQANDLGGPDNVYHSKIKTKKGHNSALDDFRSFLIATVFVVNAANEGLNFPGVDQAIIVQGDSNPRTLVQRIGRAIRWREGHRAMIWIMVTPDTQDEEWLNASLKDFDKSNITHHSHKEFLPS